MRKSYERPSLNPKISDKTLTVTQAFASIMTCKMFTESTGFARLIDYYFLISFRCLTLGYLDVPNLRFDYRYTKNSVLVLFMPAR